MTDSTDRRNLNPVGDARENDDPEQLVADGLEDERAVHTDAHQNDDPEQIVADGLEEKK